MTRARRKRYTRPATSTLQPDPHQRTAATIDRRSTAVRPRSPTSRINLIAGTKGIFRDYPPRIYFDGMNKDESLGTIDAWKHYEHPLWKREGEIAQKVGGHGGMDFIMIYRLLQCLREGLPPPDMDVYDAAAWSSVGPLSVESVSRGSAPVEVPDFTRGKWQSRQISKDRNPSLSGERCHPERSGSGPRGTKSMG